MTPGAVARRSLHMVTGGMPRVLRRWPGLLAVLGVYVAVAVPLAVAGVGYPNVIGIVAATLAAGGWYASPIGRREAARRLNSRGTASG